MLRKMFRLPHFARPRLFHCLRGGFCLARLETLHAASRVDELILAGVERVALGADFHMDFLASGPHGERVSAAAVNSGFRIIGRVNIGLCHDT